MGYFKQLHLVKTFSSLYLSCKLNAIYIVFCLAFIAPFYANAETMYVITRENAIRHDCRFFSPIKSHVRYGDVLEVISSEGDWYRVKFRAITGCIHRGALENRSVSSFHGISGQRQTATEQEIALAGKGFNPEVENAFKQRHPEMNFNLVDAIERYRVDEMRVAEFMRLGGLVQP